VPAKKKTAKAKAVRKKAAKKKGAAPKRNPKAVKAAKAFRKGRVAERTVRKTPEHPNEAIRKSGDRPCPLCDYVMTSRKVRGVTAEFCASHGIWFDSGEFERIIKNRFGHAASGRRRTRRTSSATDSSDASALLSGFLAFLAN
jgi:Zn-finger nucleic acid-binding protein